MSIVILTLLIQRRFIASFEIIHPHPKHRRVTTTAAAGAAAAGAAAAGAAAF